MSANVSLDVLNNHKVNHVALVLDRSGSMRPLAGQLVKVVDSLVADLKEESDRLGHETRISLYDFDYRIRCLVWDMDVKHLPSVKGLYQTEGGATALIEATCKALDDLGHIWEGYGQHAFLTFTVSDGLENASGASVSGRAHHGDMRVLGPWIEKISGKLKEQPAHWTSAILVPDVLAKRKAESYGFPTGNIAIWDATSTQGMEEAVGAVRTATTNFLRGRDRGIHGSKNLFAVGQDLDVATVKSVLTPLDRSKYSIFEVKDQDHDIEIRDFVQSKEIAYVPRTAYYEMGPRVTVQANKDVLVYDTDTERVYGGADARELLFGPDGRTSGSLSVKAGHNPKLKVFVMSGSYNRKLKKRTKLLVML